MAMSVIFDSSPILSHSRSSGTQASDGTARTAPSVGPKKRSHDRREAGDGAQQQAQRGTDDEPDEHALRGDDHVLGEQASVEQVDAGLADRARGRAAGRRVNQPRVVVSCHSARRASGSVSASASHDQRREPLAVGTRERPPSVRSRERTSSRLLGRGRRRHDDGVTGAQALPIHRRDRRVGRCRDGPSRDDARIGLRRRTCRFDERGEGGVDARLPGPTAPVVTKIGPIFWSTSTCAAAGHVVDIEVGALVDDLARDGDVEARLVGEELGGLVGVQRGPGTGRARRRRRRSGRRPACWPGTTRWRPGSRSC